MHAHEACPSCGYTYDDKSDQHLSFGSEQLGGVLDHVAQQTGWDVQHRPAPGWYRGGAVAARFATPTGGEIMAQLEPHPKHGSLHLSGFGRRDGQPGEGAQFMNALKGYADQQGENLTWDAFNSVGQPFYDKLGWNLQKTPWAGREDDGQPQTPYLYQYTPQPAQVAPQQQMAVARVAAQTRRQLLELAAGLPNDTSEAVHEWPNGWSVRRPTTYGDTDRMGQLMGNCWALKSIYDGDGYAGAYDTHPDWPRNPFQDGSGHYPVDLIDANQYEQISGNLGVPIEPRSARRVLADPDGIPHAAWAESHGQILEPLGRHNAPLKPEYSQMMRDYAAAHNIDSSSVDIHDTSRQGRWMEGPAMNQDDMLKYALYTCPPILPPKSQSFGSSTVEWWEPNRGEAVIMARGGTVDDRAFAEQFTKIALETLGIKRVSFTIEGEGFRKTADWPKIMAKAKRLIQSGQVHVLRNGWNSIVGHVIGDHGEYNTEIGRDDPNSRAITTWQCECPWDQYAWQRTRQWKKYEGRPCAHVLALYWAALATPLDDYDPNQHGPMPPGQNQGPPPGPSGPPIRPPEGVIPSAPASPSSPPIPGPPSTPGPPSPFSQQEGAQEGPGPQAPLAPPGGSGALPPAPMDQLQEAMAPPPVPGATPPGAPAPPGTVTVPGARPPSPFNPVQYPGGTYSAQQGDPYINGEIVRTTDDAYGLKEGRDGATDAGQYHLIEAGTTGEVLGQDPTTGWVEVIFPLDGGPMTSYHARCFLEPRQVQKTRIRPPGPMIQRRK